MIVAHVRLAAAEGGRDQMVALFRSLSSSTRTLVGCTSCDLLEETDDPCVLHYLECWESEDELKRHVQSERFATVLAALEASARPPDLKFQWVTVERGLDYVAALRLGTDGHMSDLL